MQDDVAEAPGVVATPPIRIGGEPRIGTRDDYAPASSTLGLFVWLPQEARLQWRSARPSCPVVWGRVGNAA
jgi:hypothetical protein